MQERSSLDQQGWSARDGDFGAAEARARGPWPDSWFRSLVEQSLVGTYVIQDVRFLYVNPKLAELFGYTADEVLSTRTVIDLVAPKDRALVLENLRQRLSGEVASIRYH